MISINRKEKNEDARLSEDQNRADEFLEMVIDNVVVANVGVKIEVLIVIWVTVNALEALGMLLEQPPILKKHYKFSRKQSFWLKLVAQFTCLFMKNKWFDQFLRLNRKFRRVYCNHC